MVQHHDGGEMVVEAAAAVADGAHKDSASGAATAATAAIADSGGVMVNTSVSWVFAAASLVG